MLVEDPELEVTEEVLLTRLELEVMLTPVVALDMVVEVTMLELLLEVHPYQSLELGGAERVVADDHLTQLSPAASQPPFGLGETVPLGRL